MYCPGKRWTGDIEAWQTGYSSPRRTGLIEAITLLSNDIELRRQSVKRPGLKQSRSVGIRQLTD
jgi:hypothetical protein